ncbi:MAG: hypothetical protein AAGA27_03620 [Pseudomonadota bacterium]
MKKISVLLIVVIFSFSLSVVFGSTNDVTVTYKCILNGKHPGQSYCALVKTENHSPIPRSLIGGATIFGFGTLNNAFYAGSVSDSPFSKFYLPPANAESYPFSNTRIYSFTVVAKHVSLEPYSFRGYHFFAPVFTQPASESVSTQLSSCKITEGNIPIKIKQYPLFLDLYGSIQDFIICKSD